MLINNLRPFHFPCRYPAKLNAHRKTQTNNYTVRNVYFPRVHGLINILENLSLFFDVFVRSPILASVNTRFYPIMSIFLAFLYRVHVSSEIDKRLRMCDII